MKLFQEIILNILLIVLTLVIFVSTAMAEVPVRISIKFILDAQGNPPVNGNCSTLADVNAHVVLGNRILSNAISELRFDLVETVDVANIDQYYNANIVNAIDQLRNDALNNPALFAWRNDAINIYINNDHGDASGVGSFPPDNDIIMLSQSCRDTTLIHEIGHNLNLYHTFRNEECWLCDDGCADTILDLDNNPMPTTIDDVAMLNFNKVYAQLTPAQQEQVNMVWFNVMSYHPTRDRLLHCQMDRESTQGYSDRSWLYTRRPTYVDSAFKICWRDGSFYCPFSNLQDALNAGGLTGRVLVLQEGSYAITQTDINDDLEIVTRFGPSTISHSPDRALYILPDVEQSASPEVRAAIRAAKEEEHAARKAVKEGEKAASTAATPAEKSAIRVDAEKKEKHYLNMVLNHLLEADKYASGDEKIAIQLELAQRYMHSGNCGSAIIYYELVANTTDQKYLREEALQLAEKCREELKKENSK